MRAKHYCGVVLAAGLTWRPAPPVHLTRLGSLAGSLGAAAMAMTHVGRSADLAGWRAVPAR